MSMWWCLQLRREVSSVPLARRLLLGAMDTAGVDQETSYDLCLALSEACANAVEHGAGTGGYSEAYQVTVRLRGDRCRVEVADFGPGFRRSSGAAAGWRTRAGGRGVRRFTRRSAEAERGRGLFLIESLADHVRVRNRHGRGGGAVITFDKTLKWRQAEERALLKAG